MNTLTILKAVAPNPKVSRLDFSRLITLAASLLSVCFLAGTPALAELRLSTFEVDATPEVGSPLAYDPMKEATLPLSCRGIVLLPDGDPIVVCAVDWLGVANQANLDFRKQLAEAVGTPVERVVVHALHQHDAPRCDLSAVAVLEEFDRAAAEHFDVPFIELVMREASQAAKESLDSAQLVTKIGVGAAVVEQVASNRRMLGPDGKVHTTRYTACRDPDIRALPEGVVDPTLRLLTFEGEQGPLVAWTFYATHPQSYYRTGGANPDFPGMARNSRQAATGVFHLHLNGAGGNIGAGKYNDGSTENRQILAERVASAMRKAWEDRHVKPLADDQLDWQQVTARLPVADHLQAESLEKTLRDESSSTADQLYAAKKLGFLRRADEQRRVAIPISRLTLGDSHILFMPGELFVEYQLAAQELRPGANVMMAAYGDYGTAYIGTRAAYPQGGYEVSPRATNVSPEVEQPLLDAMKQLLDAKDSRVYASDFTDRSGPLPR